MASGLRLIATVDITPEDAREEQWNVTLDFQAEDAVAAEPEASSDAHSWFALMVKVNIVEWWHTRITEPNMPHPPCRIK
ncbi:hypothetical protein [Streptomyces sp. NBC_00829]|uniref:hypothetical protein n=1 Tax=Streptomyces sp. NBC_00829 TaxID=2903679 RepID=UPI002F915EBC|nr:hypothetical protein OG293_40180 [Streptomyces sp. NBC_00829]